MRSENVFGFKRTICTDQSLSSEGRLGASEHVFDALNYNPYDDDVNDQFGGTYHSVAMPNYSYKLSFEDMAAYPVDYGICDEEETEIKAGAPLTSLEKQLIDDKIFEHDDTYIVINKFSDTNEEVFGLKVHQVQGQLGIQVILGFFSTEEAAEAILECDYKILFAILN